MSMFSIILESEKLKAVCVECALAEWLWLLSSCERLVGMRDDGIVMRAVRGIFLTREEVGWCLFRFA